MNWKTFHIENISRLQFFGMTIGLLFGHTPTGCPVLTLIVAHNKWAKAIQLGG